MIDPSVLIDREALLAELGKAFDPPTAEVLLRVLDQVAGQLHRGGEISQQLRNLTQVVADLAAAQARTDEAVRELAAAQARTEERVGGLEGAIERLAAAQARTEERIGHLATALEHTDKALERLSRQVGGLSESIGGDIEDIAYIVLHDVLNREFGWQVGVLQRTWQKWDEVPEEVNVFGQATDPARAGRAIWIVGEAKHNLTRKEVARFRHQVQRAKKHLVGEVFPVCFCYRARPEVQEMVRDAGIRLVFSYGKLV